MRKSQEIIFVYTFTSSANKETLSEFIMRLESGKIKGCYMRTDEVVMDPGDDLTGEFVIVQISTNKENIWLLASN